MILVQIGPEHGTALLVLDGIEMRGRVDEGNIVL
jgi:hypothetical protein